MTKFPGNPLLEASDDFFPTGTLCLLGFSYSSIVPLTITLFINVCVVLCPVMNAYALSMSVTHSNGTKSEEEDKAKIAKPRNGRPKGFSCPIFFYYFHFKKIFDNFLNFTSNSSLRVIIWDNLPHWIDYVALKLSTMHLTNDVTFIFNSKDYFVKLMQR